MITRRALAGAAAALAVTRHARAQVRPRVLRFVPQSDLLGLDPVWTTGFVVRNAAYMRGWLLEPDPARREALALQMQAEAFRQVPFVPLGQYRLATAYRKAITALVPSSVPMFWGLRPG